MAVVAAGARLAVPMTYGENWHDNEWPGYLCALRWIEETEEIYLKPHYPPVYLPDIALSGGYPIGPGAIKVDVLGWADDQTALEQALEGRETHPADSDGVRWIRRRLAEAAAATTEQATARPTDPST